MRPTKTRAIVRVRPRLRGGRVPVRELRRTVSDRMDRILLPLALVVACRARADDRSAPFELGPDVAEVGYGESFRIEARGDEAGEVTWTQIGGRPLEEVAADRRGFRFSAKMPELRTMKGSLPWGIVPLSPTTRGEVVLEAEWHPSRGGGTLRRTIRVAAAA